MQYSMNMVGEASVFRGPSAVATSITLNGEPTSAGARSDVSGDLEISRRVRPGTGAGEMPVSRVEVEMTSPAEAPEAEDAPDMDGPVEVDGEGGTSETEESADEVGVYGEDEGEPIFDSEE